MAQDGPLMLAAQLPVGGAILLDHALLQWLALTKH